MLGTAVRRGEEQAHYFNVGGRGIAGVFGFG
jgi:hypothetical protein